MDHVIEINDDYSKRLDWDNLKSLCYSCHSIKTHGEKKRRQKETVSGYWLIEQIKQIKRKDNKK
ncbi:hypothetical protein C942_00492 [Photobacterium marinum]|uniref:HNH domain-containing protein n=1 Tax=Photobacterium marinum TaxID=1056511 RepID=L8JB14_9GAMM|nr:hypothetical protein C942_00492 [Photobacterium marinum]